MKLTLHGNEIEVSGISDFDPGKTLECGQCFRWDPDTAGIDNSYYLTAHGRVIKIRKSGDSVFITCPPGDFNAVWRNYFDLNRDYAEIRKNLCTDDFMCRATDYGKGIRLLRQEKWEALCSFIISQNNNIPRIKSIINTLCRKYGDEIIFEEKQFYSFPPASRLASAVPGDLAPLRCGYRADYIISAAGMVDCGEIDLEALAGSSPAAARTELKKIRGVGDKVADCVILFGLHMLDAFPLDVWMKRAVNRHFSPGFNPGIFSPYAGIAQQYIFHYIRNNTCE